jgi:phospholipase C
MARINQTLFSITSLFLLSFSVACGSGSHSSGSGGGNGGGGGSSAPTVQSFAITPTVAGPQQNVNFSWSTANATTFTTTPNIAMEDQSLPLQSSTFPYIVNQTTTTTFTAAASNGTTNSAPVSAVLTVVPVTLSASAMSIPAGRSVTLSYSGPNNGSTYVLTLTPSSNPPVTLSPTCTGNTCTGTYTAGPLGTTTAFSLAANGPKGGQATSPTVTVTVTGALTLNFTANPSNIPPGGNTPVTLAWQTMNAVTVSIDQGIGSVPVNGMTTVHPSQTTTYTATATDQYNDQLQVSATVTVGSGGVSKLNHIIFMVQENRAFDNYFGVFSNYRVNVDHIPGAQLSDVNDLHNLPPGYTLMNPQGQSFPPFHERTVCIENLSPSWDETHTDMDLVGGDWLNLSNSSQYLMDKFLFTTKSGGTGDQYDPTHSRPLGYYDQTDLPFYYELGAQFTTDDSWYSPIPANTLPNRLYLFTGTSYGHGYPPPPGDPVWQQPTIFRALTNAGITWRYYYQDNSVFLAQFSDWNDPNIQSNVRNIQEWYNILANQNADTLLPQVVFIERASATGYDEHPGNNIQLGALRVQTVMGALLNSPAWQDSAFILTYDEGGGVYDQQGPILVTPPDNQQPNDLQGHIQGLFNVTGFRVPIIVVSPYSRPQTVTHLQGDYTSILKLIETRYSIPPLTQRDATAADMTDPVNGFFDFSSPHLLTVPPLPTQPTNGVCDFSLEGYPQ